MQDFLLDRHRGEGRNVPVRAQTGRGEEQLVSDGEVRAASVVANADEKRSWTPMIGQVVCKGTDSFADPISVGT
jgi:hypothetical protein